MSTPARDQRNRNILKKLKKLKRCTYVLLMVLVLSLGAFFWYILCASADIESDLFNSDVACSQIVLAIDATEVLQVPSKLAEGKPQPGDSRASMLS